MGRFLIFFSYFGTRYSGVQKQADAVVRGKPIRTVIGALEEAMKYLKPSNEIKISVSSRTDRGVHAQKNTCHVDLIHPCSPKEYDPLVITNILNFYLKDKQEDIRVLQTKRVSEAFNARFCAKGRKYIYRLGHIVDAGVRSDTPLSYNSGAFYQEMRMFETSRYAKSGLPLGEPLSALDASKATIYRTPLDISKLIAAAEMVSGIHNYKSFTSQWDSNPNYLPHPMKMLTIGVKRGQPLGHQLQKYSLDMSENIEFWDIHVHSKSFMYRQIRRLVGAMVLVAKDKISLAVLQGILDNPQTDFPFASQMVASDAGLFLADVVYDPKDLEFVETAQAEVLSNLPQVSGETDVMYDSRMSSSQNETVRKPSVEDQHDSDGESDLLSDDVDDDDSVYLASGKLSSENVKSS